MSKFTTICEFQNVIAIPLVSSLLLLDVVQFQPESFADAKIECRGEFAISANHSIGTCISTIPKGARNVIVTYLGFWVGLECAIPTAVSVFANHRSMHGAALNAQMELTTLLQKICLAVLVSSVALVLELSYTY